MHVPSTKIAIPDLPAGFVPRPELRQLLEDPAASSLVVVSATAGYGKTVLLSDWAQHHADEVAWVSIDSADNDPRRLRAAVRAALAEITDAIPRKAEAAEREGDVDDLLIALDKLRRPVSLVLDDLHELKAPEAIHDLARLVRLRPQTLRVVLASRVDHALMLQTNRLDGRLREIRAEHLRFSADVTARLMKSSGLLLTPAQVDILCTRTDGWAAGLRLAAVALRHSDDPDHLLADFSGDERSVADYLAGEVLAGLEADVLAFLRAMSVCAPLSTDLAALLSARDDAGAVLDRVRHETGLVTRVGPDEFRIHALLRSYLLADLRRRSPGLRRELHARAARWWADRAETTHAVQHAEQADDETLVELLHRFAAPLLVNGELDTLRRAIAVAGPLRQNDDPELALLAAMLHLERREHAAAAGALERARGSWRDAASAEAEALRTSVELVATTAGIGTLRPDHLRPITLDAPEPTALLTLSRGLALLHDPDQRAGARPEFEQALAMARANDLELLEVNCRTMLAALDALEGDIRGMRRHAEESVGVARRTGHLPSASAAASSALIAYADLLGGSPTCAVERAAGALHGSPALPPEVAFTLHAVHAAGRADQGEGAAGLAEASATRGQFDDDGIPPEWLTALAVLEYRVATILGNLRAAERVVEWLERRVGQVGEIILMKAWTAAAAGHHDAAVAGLARLTDGTVATVLSHTPLEVSLLRGEAYLQVGDIPSAQSMLVEALAAGRALGVVRPFVLAGPATRDLLGRWGRRAGRDRFLHMVAEVLTVVRPEVTAPLSGREITVLELLPSLLSAREIACELSVSVNTVKTHIRAIYSKLRVDSRHDAVMRAREHGLL
jgi:LuxR family transcriptional regulator, maltose regulon positive regulatory protein